MARSIKVPMGACFCSEQMMTKTRLFATSPGGGCGILAPSAPGRHVFIITIPTPHLQTERPLLSAL